MTTLTTYPLRLPTSIKAAAEELSKADGTSLNQFVATAVAEKIAVLKTVAYFEQRAARARAAASQSRPSVLMAALARPGGEPPRVGDEPLRSQATRKTAKPITRKAVVRKAKSG